MTNEEYNIALNLINKTIKAIPSREVELLKKFNKFKDSIKQSDAGFIVAIELFKLISNNIDKSKLFYYDVMSAYSGKSISEMRKILADCD